MAEYLEQIPVLKALYETANKKSENFQPGHTLTTLSCNVDIFLPHVLAVTKRSA